MKCSRNRMSGRSPSSARSNGPGGFAGRRCTPETTTCGGPKKSIGRIRPTTSPSPIRIPDRMGGVAPKDAPGVPQTYYEPPLSLSPRQFAGTTLVDWPGNQTYKTFEVAATRRLSGGWQLNGSVSFTRADADFADRQALNPNSEINTSERFWENTAKVWGGYVRPFEIVASANYERRLGAPQSRQVQYTGRTTIRSIVLNTDPLGTIRLPSTNLVDFRFAKRLRF